MSGTGEQKPVEPAQVVIQGGTPPRAAPQKPVARPPRRHANFGREAFAHTQRAKHGLVAIEPKEKGQ